MVYFNNIQSEILSRIREAKTSLKIAVAWFNNDILFNTVLEKLASGCKVDLIVINDKTNNSGLDFQKFVNDGGNFYFSNEAPGKGIVHHKFCIIDESLVITGSYNWTKKAEHYNSENITVFSEKGIVEKFNDEFEKVLILSKPKVNDISVRKKMDNYSEEILTTLPISSEFTTPDNTTHEHSIRSAEITINIIDKVNKEECRFSWDRYNKSPCDIIINPNENMTVEFPAGVPIPENGLTSTIKFHTLVENISQLSIYVVKNEGSEPRRRVHVLKNLSKKPIGATILEMQLHLNQLGDLNVESREIDGEQVSRNTIKEIFSKSKLRIKQD